MVSSVAAALSFLDEERGRRSKQQQLATGGKRGCSRAIGIGFLLFWAFLVSAAFAFHSNILSKLFLPAVTMPICRHALSLSLFLCVPLSLSYSYLSAVSHSPCSLLVLVQCRDCGKQVYLGKFRSCPSSLSIHIHHTLIEGQRRGCPIRGVFGSGCMDSSLTNGLVL
jgi:hypothetical protein